MLKSKIVTVALAMALSLTAASDSFARGFGGFGGGHFGGFGSGARFGGARFGGFHPGFSGGFRPGFAGGIRPGFAGGIRSGFVRPGFGGRFAFFHHHRRFFFPGLAFGAGLALGGYPYYDPYYYDNGYYDDGYYGGGGYYGGAPVSAPSDAVAYCMQRYRTYNPATGTFIGRGGIPHPCP